MKSDRIEELTQRGDRAQAQVETLDQEIANALADGVDDETLADMRRRRRQLIEEADDVGEALVVLEKRAADPQEKLRAAIAAGAIRDARRHADEYTKSAAAVDDAFAALEASFEALETGARRLQRALYAAGVGDAARISNTLQPSLRWALWRSSPKLAKAIGLSHTPFNKRQTLTDSARRVIPNIPSVPAE